MTDDGARGLPAQAAHQALETGLAAIVLCLALFKWAAEVQAGASAPPPDVGQDTLDRLAASPLRYLAYALTVAALLAVAHFLRRMTRALRLSLPASEPLTIGRALEVARAWWAERTSGLQRHLTIGHFLLGFGAVTVVQALLAVPLAPRGSAVDAAGATLALPHEVAPVGTATTLRLSPGLGEVSARVTGGSIVVDGEPVGPGRHALRDGAVVLVGDQRLVVKAPDVFGQLGASLLGQTLGIAALVLAAARLAGRDGLAALGLTTTGLAAEVRRGALGFLAVLPPYTAALALWSAAGDALGLTPAGHPLVVLLEREGLRLAALIFVQAALLAPLQEELLYRGLLLPAFARVVGPLAAVLGSSLVFGAMHPGFLFLLPMAVLGSLFAGLYATSRHRSLVASITAHALFNGVTLIFVIGVQLG